MQLNEIGEIADALWTEIPKQFPFIELGKYVIMPNHIHGLLTVETQFIASGNDNIASGNNNQDAINCVSTGGFAGNKNPFLNKNISRVIRWYKGRCTFEIRKIHADFLWQTRFMIILYVVNSHCKHRGLYRIKSITMDRRYILLIEFS